MSDWDILDDNGNGNDEDVEYVGVVEEDEATSFVQEPTRMPRQAVRRVVPAGQVVYPVRQSRQHPNGVIGAPNRDQEDLVSYINMPHGKQLGLTAEAMERINTTPMMRMNGQMAQRIEPGTYVMYGPSRAEAMAMGMGTNGTTPAAPTTSSGPGWLGDLFGAVADLGGGIATAVQQGQASRREADTARYQAQLEFEAAAEARDYAFQEAQLEHAERLYEIEAGAAELETLRAQAEEAAALRASLPATTVTTAAAGTSPIVWVLVAVLGLGAVGGIIWFVSKQKEDKD